MAEEVMNNKQIILKHYVEGYPKESDMEFKNNNIKLNVQEGSNVVILKNLYLSCDHYMRSHMSKLEGSYFQVLTEYILVSITSAVTVTIAGVVKEAVTILVAVFYFHDDFTWMKGFGLMTIMFGVSLFNWYKYDKIHKGSTSEDETAGSPLGNAATKYVILEEMEDQDHGS